MYILYTDAYTHVNSRRIQQSETEMCLQPDDNLGSRATVE